MCAATHPSTKASAQCGTSFFESFLSMRASQGRLGRNPTRRGRVETRATLGIEQTDRLRENSFYTHRGPHRLPDLLSGAHAENKDDDITDAF